jgi:2-polyprenyl-6-methoxyphenol hydroxylase-like FAD-dependent oxidoreductase
MNVAGVREVEGADGAAGYDVIVVGAGPAGLMLAAELRLAGVRPLVIERRPRLQEVEKANGIGGHILDLLAYRGLMERLEAVSTQRRQPAPRFPFGTLQVDLANMPEPPLRGVSVPQRVLERMLDERVHELGGEVRRGHELIGLSDDAGGVTAQVRGPEGGAPYQARARFVVGCDGPRSRVRELAGIAFPGTTYAEVNRVAHVVLAVEELEDGALRVPGLGPVRPGFTRTDRGVFAFGRRSAGGYMIQTTEAEPADVDDADSPLTAAELGDSIRRVLGADLPIASATRLTRYGFQARQVGQYRHGRILVAGDAAHVFPATGVGLNVGMTDAVDLAWKLGAEIRGWAPEQLLDTYHVERHYAGARTMLQTQAQVALRRGGDDAAEALRRVLQELLLDEPAARRIGALIAGADLRYPTTGPGAHPLTGTRLPNLRIRTGRDGEGSAGIPGLLEAARPVLLVLTDRPELLKTAEGWADRVDARTAEADEPPADALLIRPDAYVAWAAEAGQSQDTAVAGLREALITWFGKPA